MYTTITSLPLLALLCVIITDARSLNRQKETEPQQQQPVESSHSSSASRRAGRTSSAVRSSAARTALTSDLELSEQPSRYSPITSDSINSSVAVVVLLKPGISQENGTYWHVRGGGMVGEELGGKNGGRVTGEGESRGRGGDYLETTGEGWREGRKQGRNDGASGRGGDPEAVGESWREGRKQGRKDGSRGRDRGGDVQGETEEVPGRRRGVDIEGERTRGRSRGVERGEDARGSAQTVEIGEDGGQASATEGQSKQRLIRGSKTAATITKREYLKKDWCKTEPFHQVIHEPGCLRKRITNRFCYGQCNSFFIPKTDEEDQDAGSFRSCAYCTPIDSVWTEVILTCPMRSPRLVAKRVQIVTQCKCMAVNLEVELSDGL